MSDDNFISEEIMKTYYANSSFPSGEELKRVGIDPTRVFRIQNSPQTPLPAFLAQVEDVLEQILAREEKKGE